MFLYDLNIVNYFLFCFDVFEFFCRIEEVVGICFGLNFVWVGFLDEVFVILFFCKGDSVFFVVEVDVGVLYEVVRGLLVY